MGFRKGRRYEHRYMRDICIVISWFDRVILNAGKGFMSY